MTAHLSHGNGEGRMEVLVFGVETMGLLVPVRLLTICQVHAVCCIRYLNSIATRELPLSEIREKGDLS